MKPLCILFIFLEFIISVPAIGQEGKELKNAIGVSFFVLEQTSETLNPTLAPKFVFGADYNRYFSNWSWIWGMESGKNSINEDPGCCDFFYGKGKMTEFTVSTGLRYTFLQKKKFFIKPLLESDLYYSYIRYAGDFGGGFSGDGIKLDKSYNVAGLTFKAGFSVYPIQKISITVLASARHGWGTVKDHYDYKTEPVQCAALTVIHLGAGYLF